MNTGTEGAANERAVIGSNSKLTRGELESAFRQRTRDQRITENTPFDLRWQWEVWLSDLTPNGKLVAFAVRIFASHTGSDSRPSIDSLVQLTGLSRQTVVTQLRAIQKELLLTAERGKGRAASTYTLIVPERTIAEIASVIDIRSGLPIRPLDGRSSLPARPQGDLVAVQPLDHNDRSSLIPDRSSLPIRPDITKDITEEEKGRGSQEGSIGRMTAALAAGLVAAVAPQMAAAEPRPVEHVQSVPAECWQTGKAQMDAATNPHEARAQKQVWITPTGMVEVAGDFKTELVTTFPLVDMASGLAASGPNIKRDRSALDAMTAVRRQFGYMQQDALRRQAAAKARQAPEPPKKSNQRPRAWD